MAHCIIAGWKSLYKFFLYSVIPKILNSCSSLFTYNWIYTSLRSLLISTNYLLLRSTHPSFALHISSCLCPSLIISISLSPSPCLYLLVFISLSLSPYLYLLVSTSLSLSPCLYPLVSNLHYLSLLFSTPYALPFSSSVLISTWHHHKAHTFTFLCKIYSHPCLCDSELIFICLYPHL